MNDLRYALRMLQCIAKRSEEHTSELQSHSDLVCRLLLEKKKKKISSRAEADKLAGESTMFFDVPNMYHRLDSHADKDNKISKDIGKGRMMLTTSYAIPSV